MAVDELDAKNVGNEAPSANPENYTSKVKRGNLERKLDFGTCCSGMICSKSKAMFVWEAHLSTVKASKGYLTSLLHLECTADQLLRVQKLVGGVTWNASCLGT